MSFRFPEDFFTTCWPFPDVLSNTCGSLSGVPPSLTLLLKISKLLFPFQLRSAFPLFFQSVDLQTPSHICVQPSTDRFTLQSFVCPRCVVSAGLFFGCALDNPRAPSVIVAFFLIALRSFVAFCFGLLFLHKSVLAFH